MSDMKAYLAEKYMSGPKADAILSKVGKKKRRKVTTLTSQSAPLGAMLVDEDGGWGDEVKEDGDELQEAVVEKDRGFKKRKLAGAGETSGWATVREGMKEESPPPPEDEQPIIVEDQKAFTGGLLSAKDLRKVLPKAKVTESTTQEIAAAQDTVYRDASGRKLDMAVVRAEAARKKREKEEKEALKMEWGKGLVQREEQEKRKLELEKQRGTEFSRRADDADLNEDLKSRDLWNDPAAAFLTKKRTKGPRKPQYNGPLPPPNRFGIKPGYRWDGVDRGNGYEKKYFQRTNEKKRRGAESYQWSVDDM